MIENTECNCGEKITVRSGADAKMKGRKDGKQVVYTRDQDKPGQTEYDIFRCESCGKPISETCKAAAYSWPPQ